MTALPPVLVLGAGVIGLSVAVTLAEMGYRVHVRTAEPPQATTSAVAGALWSPWLVEPRDRILPWAEHTLTVLRELAGRPGTGVRLISAIEVSNVPHDPPDWAHLISDRRLCTPGELPSGYTYGICCTVPQADMPTYLGYLTNRFTAAGGTITIDPVTSLDDVVCHAPLIVNCTGLGARALVPDHDLYPIRGQHVIVTNPGLTHFIQADNGDFPALTVIFPHNDRVVLGGIAEPGKWERTPDPATGQAILERCTRLEPRLADTQIIDHLVGLRPGRPNVRVELQRHPCGAIIAHNYGHGGAGVSLSWGCAREITTLLNAATAHHHK